MSHGLQSSPHTTHTAVLPNPPTNLVISRVQGNTVSLSWDPPTGSLFTDYHIQYRPVQVKIFGELLKNIRQIFKKYSGGCDERAARLDPCQQRAAERVLLRAAGPYTR